MADIYLNSVYDMIQGLGLVPSVTRTPELTLTDLSSIADPSSALSREMARVTTGITNGAAAALRLEGEERARFQEAGVRVAEEVAARASHRARGAVLTR